MIAPLDIPAALLKAPFTTAMAGAQGLSPTVLQGARFRRLWHDVYVHRDLTLTPELLASGVALVLPDTAIASHLTAAELLGAQVPWSPPPHFWMPQTCTGRAITGVHLHRYDIRPASIDVDGMRVTTAYNTFVDLATVLNLVQLVAVGDSLVRIGRVTPEQLVGAAKEKGRRHIRKARAAASYVRRSVDSPRESDLRMLFCLALLPEPQVNRDVFDGCLWLARPDLSYPAYRIAIEYDGRHHWRTSRQRERDIRRVEDLSRRGWLVIVVTHEQLRGDPYGVLVRVHQALQERGHPGSPQRLHRAWRPYF